MNGPILFRSVDIAVFATSLANRLRLNGVGAGMASTERFSRAFFCCQPDDKSSLYWVARTCLVHDRRDLAAFDSVFAEVFDDQSLAVSRGLNSPKHATVRSFGSVAMRSAPDNGLSLASGRNAAARQPEIVDNRSVVEDPKDSVLPELLPSAVSKMADTPFDQLNAEDLTILGTWLEQVLTDYPQRLSRRLRASAKGRQVDLRATLLAARATAGEPLRLHRREPRLKPRGIVAVADVSGSMESFTRIYLHLMRSLVIGGNAEVFTFATSLRRVTAALRDKDPAAAIDAMTDEVRDRFSGTRVAGSLKQLLLSPVWSNTVRGSVVLIASDGWDVDAGVELARRMRQLRRLAHRVIWVNPRAAQSDYEPLVGGMEAALPHVDDFLSGHSLNAMREVLAAMAAASGRHREGRPPSAQVS
ncbi:MAG: VWA domain-containing protein [Acidimicrobiaceae bacterium]|nr:VWA domain-containing protein [Acidimicrobiia bacterium]MCY4494681.1 VWA domain-containing protein [Acidimicrobiaceae bacterium]